MISFTLENDLILKVFQLLVSGLILSATLAVYWLQKKAFVRRILRWVAAAFCLYSLHFLLRAIVSYRSLALPISLELSPHWEYMVQSVETLALFCLGLGYLPHWLPERPGVRFWALAGGVATLLLAGPVMVQQYWPAGSPSAVVNAVLLAGVIVAHLERKGRSGLFAAAPLGVLWTAQFLRAVSLALGSPERFWAAENAAVLVGLGLFALVVDVRSGNLQVRFFLRLNLIFIAIASLLILIVSETERREHLRMAESRAEEMCEFLRGHLIYFHKLGLPPAETLSHPEIIRKVTSEFGRLPDLRAVRVSFRGWVMEMEIGSDWTVRHEVRPGDLELTDARPGRGERRATLTPVPVMQAGRMLGRIEVVESLRSINTRVGRQLRIIFVTFSIAVFVAAGLFGFTVRDAHRTIQRQFAELESTHAQLVHAARLASVGQLAGGLAHEINNPAGIILTTSDYLLREAHKLGLADGLREDLEAIGRQARRISNVVSGLLTFSRPTVLHRRATQINEVLRQSVALLTPRFGEQRVKVEEQLGSHLPQLTADPDRLEQVFVNLLNNATDAMPQGGLVRVESACQQRSGRQHLVVSVADTGCGIPEEHRKSIFDPFFTTKSKGQGTGLGLSVSYGIVRDHGGQIEVESRAGQGTVFRVLLPVRGAGYEEL